MQFHELTCSSISLYASTSKGRSSNYLCSLQEFCSARLEFGGNHKDSNYGQDIEFMLQKALLCGKFIVFLMLKLGPYISLCRYMSVYTPSFILRILLPGLNGFKGAHR